ncbi:DNA/RNA non-specific endonuclease [Allomuricauda sp. CP2A]|jgi:endonuclease G|uniref:DNA/RNA non-specific endonuclease n=1 Tax=Allomuricauda sp. CP2A TaxID=1848189 RepID=UPI00082B8637|nr:DNA/RNA non-specific endonuclease [Muricauda sp. CP2A]
MKAFNLSQRIVKNDKILAEMENKFGNMEFPEFGRTAIIGDNDEVDFKKLGEQLTNRNFDLNDVQEAIINVMGRPVLEIRDDSFDVNEPELDFWKDILKKNKKGLTKVIPSIGRIELAGHPSLDWVGTGWLYQDDYIITNRHVAQEFATRLGERFVFKRNFLNEAYSCSIDFKEELNNPTSKSYVIGKVLHIEPESGYDMAILQIVWDDNNAKFPSLELANKLITDETIATIGYPARDSRTKIPEDQIRIFSDVFDKKRLAVGEIDYVDPDKQFFIHDCTTLGGNSGSPIVDIETQKVYGLHFAGRERQGNFAIPAVIIDRIFKNTVTNKRFFISEGEFDPSIELEKISQEDLKGRKGFDENFLNKKTPFPGVTKELKKELAQLKNSKQTKLDYLNYSVVMSKKKRLALATAVNIDGTQWRHITRGRDKWSKDPRIKPSEQVGNELYKYNNFDRGHLVRRMDPAWGTSYQAAKDASEDTFFYTNCAPQHKNLNQKIWLGLEEYILSKTVDNEMKICVYNGPIFSETDMFYRDIQIPESFWKVVVANKGDNGIYATAYILSQKKWLDDIEFVFGPYETYQVPVAFVQEQTGLVFDQEILDSDAMANITESLHMGLRMNQIQDFEHIVI